METIKEKFIREKCVKNIAGEPILACGSADWVYAFFEPYISIPIEPFVMQTAGNAKPPLGIVPKIIWMEQRITELSRALFEYISIGRYDETTYQWLIELYSLYRQRDKYLEEKGGSA